jgi:hypothetical protein
LAKTLLITFGCSWTYGVAVNYEPGMSDSQLKDQARDPKICDVLSWRGLLSRRLGWFNLNFSVGGSSNQCQFRKAIEFFGSLHYQELRQDFEKIIVLWGITSTARNELWSVDRNNYSNFFLSDNDDLARCIVKNCYDHDAEVAELRNRMLYWNVFFKAQHITNFWFDTFNTHNYDYDFQNNSKKKTYSITANGSTNGCIDQEHYHSVAGVDWPAYLDFCQENFDGIKPEIIEEIQRIFSGTDSMCQPYLPTVTKFIEKNSALDPITNLLDYDSCHRDLMSWLMARMEIKIPENSQQYHYSSWKIDRDGMDDLVNLGILNAHTHHPTKQGHILLCDYFSSKLDKTVSM